MSETLIYESRKSKVYRAIDPEWDFPVVMKILNFEFPTPLDIAQFYNESDIIEGLNLPGIRRSLKRTKINNRHALFLEWIEGKTIRQELMQKPAEIERFLKIATGMAKALEDVHQNRIIHKDINSNNVLIQAGTGEVKIIDFGISTKLDLRMQYLGNPELLEGTLTYNSPEQTGRVNRIVDYRTDLYSTGVLFYEILTGRVPFVSSDPMELVHCHIAVQPEPVTVFNSAVPKILSDIILKLLSKNAEDRYQSAYGLRMDLEECQKEWLEKGTISVFPLGQNDFSGRYSIPQKLYGREKQIDALLDCYNQAAKGGKKLLTVFGYSGTGKSALVHETHRAITKNRGWFLEGKFDQFQRGIPYYAILKAFREFINLLLSENEDRLNSMRQKILAAVGSEGKVLTDVLPNLELIIGTQPEVPEVGGSEAQNRFNYVFSKFTAALAAEENPLVLFIDDLQWADSSSLSLFKVLMTDPAIRHFLFIGAYRDNETDITHPLIITLDELEKSGIFAEKILLENLSENHVNELIADSLLTQPGKTKELTRLVYEKTRGNAFFLIQFLKSLANDGLLSFRFEEKAWNWNLQKIQEQNITDNVVELMANKVQKLPAETIRILKLAACIGNSFDEETLSAIYTDGNPADLLYEALSEGLVIPMGGGSYKFAHDRIQQAVYTLIPEEEKNTVHLSIGKKMLENIAPDKRDEALFDIANQWNRGIEIITTEEEKELLAKLNLDAGRKAKQSSAFQPAFNYLETGIRLLKNNAWQSQYELARDLHIDAAESAYLSGYFDKMDVLIDAVLKNAKELLEKVKPYEIRILAYKAQNRLLDAIHTGLELLEQLGESFPKKPNMLHVAKELALTFWRLRGKNNEYLLSLPIMTDPYKISAMRVIAHITSSVYWAMPSLLPLIVFRMMKLSLKYGNNAVSCFAYGSYGVILCGVLGMMRKGYSFGKLSLDLLEKLDAKEWKAQIYVSPFALTIHWNEHVKNTLGPLQDSFHIGLETGLIEFSCVNTNIYCIHAFLCGKPLSRLEEETKAYSESYLRFKQETNYNYNEVYRQAMLNFMGKSSNPIVLTGDAYNEEKMTVQNAERNDQTGAFFIHFNKLMLGVHFREMEMAKKHAEEARKLLDAVLAKFEIPNHHFYEALCLASLYPGLNGKEKHRSASRIKKNIRAMKKWSETAPENFLHKQWLMEAEWKRVKGNFNDARTLYDRAIAESAKQEFTHETALAYELTGRFYLEQEAHDLAEFYLKSAYNTYREWGATAKLRNLEQNLPKYVSGVNRATSLSESASVDEDSSMLHGSVLDMNTVLKSSTSISGEIVLSRLLNKLMAIVIENAGAEKGVLLLQAEGGLFVEAELSANSSEADVLQHIPMEECKSISGTIVTYVNRTCESVVVNNAETDIRYAKDPYILKNKIKSVLCLPIINQGKSVGVLYLENNLTTGAFTQERIDLLSLLSGQIAVSIDNALLYENLEQKVAERTAELAEEKQKSDNLLLNILPEETAQELKTKGFASPKRFESVSVLFTDFKGFTNIAESMSPEELVQQIDTVFRAFDGIIGKYGIEKIKTIGDSYMCVGGLPVPSENHAHSLVLAALEIRDYMENHKAERMAQGKSYFDIRIGIHSGPVVAGVVGSKKFAYDIWGDTVNTASRMESSCEIGKINISSSTHALISSDFETEFRGEIDAKGKGKIGMYFIHGPKNTGS